MYRWVCKHWQSKCSEELSRQHRFWVTLATATTLSQALDVFGVKSGHWCLILKHLFFIRAHNWDGKNQEDEVGGSNNAICSRKLWGFVRTEKNWKTLWKKIGSCSAGIELATLRSITHDFPFSPSPLLVLQWWDCAYYHRQMFLLLFLLHKGLGYLC